MINRKTILIFLASCGIAFISAAGIFYDWQLISSGWYFRFYAIGLLMWALRMRLQSVSLFDALVLNVIMWLCIFNVCDELFSLTPAKPYKPHVASAVVIISSLYIYLRKCKSCQKDGEKQRIS